MHRHRLIRRATRFAAAALSLAAAACTDRANPVSPSTGPGSGPPGTPVTLQALQCTASRADLTVKCAPVTPPQGSASPDIVVGGQNLYVKLTSSNVAYNGGTGQFTFDVTVQNLIEQKMGTTDGTTVDPNGIRVFFFSGPNVTSGTGTAAVVPDGFATFTAAGQPYYQYGAMLAHGQTSAARTWTLIMPSTVLTFNFLLFVSTPVQYPNGYITLNGNLPGYDYGYLHPGSPLALTAVVKSAVGAVAPGATVTFGSTNPGCATVDGSGNVTGVIASTCSITATAGARSGSMIVDVSGSTRDWIGATSTDWNVGSNWGGGLVPAAADSVTVPTGVPNFPVLTSTVTISNVTVADAATLDVAGFVLSSSGSVRTGQTAGGIVASGAGSVLLTGANQAFQGRFPAVLVTGSYALDGNYRGIAPQTVDDGTIASDLYEMDVDAQ